MSLLVTRSKIINAPASDIFDLLANPARHAEIDGSGTVRGSLPDAPTRLTKGAQFGMSMKMGVPYKMENTVVEFVENELIAWRHFGGHVWRYELKAIHGVDGGARTEVTESFDWSSASSRLLLRVIFAPQRNAKSIERTLERLAKVFS